MQFHEMYKPASRSAVLGCDNLTDENIYSQHTSVSSRLLRLLA